MVAKAVQEQTDVGQTPPNDETLAPANPAPEDSSPPVTEEEKPTSILAELGFSDEADGAGDGVSGSPDGKAPSPYVGLSDEEIEAKATEKLIARNQQQNANTQRVNYINGIKAYVRESIPAIDKMADDNMWPAEVRQAVKDRLAHVSGQYDQILGWDTQNAHTEGVRNVTLGIHQGVAAVLGEDKANALMQANHQTWDAYLNAYAEEHAAKKGYLPPATVKKEYLSKKEVAANLAELEKAANDHGWSIKALKGVPVNGKLPAMRGGTGLPTMAQYTGATFEQRMAWQKADPDIETKIIQREATRGG